MTVHYPPVRQRTGLSQDEFARRSGLHPDLLRRFVALGLVQATRGPGGDLIFATSELPRAARMQRLRAGLSLNYTALGLVMDLLDRIESLETDLRHIPSHTPSHIARARSVTWT